MLPVQEGLPIRASNGGVVFSNYNIKVGCRLRSSAFVRPFPRYQPTGRWIVINLISGQIQWFGAKVSFEIFETLEYSRRVIVHSSKNAAVYG